MMTTQDQHPGDQPTCTHHWRKVEDPKLGPLKMLVMCESCGASKTVQAPKAESSGNGKPLLLG